MKFLKKVLKKIYYLLIDNLVYYYKLIKFKLIDSKKNISGIQDNHLPDGKKIIVSLTSIPSRYSKLYLTLETIMEQTLKPDKIVLYLGENNKNIELPKELKKMTERGLTIKYVEDKKLKPHTKYFYSMQEYPNDIIITVDDDILYDKRVIENLYNSYQKHQDCISAMRVHKITFNEKKEIKSNLEWEWEYNKQDALIPNHYLDATGVGGVLYPPSIMPKETFNVEIIDKLALNADDMWLKFTEIKNNIKVVKATKKNYRLFNVKGTQEIALNFLNVHQGLNDEIIKKLVDYYNITYKDFKK